MKEKTFSELKSIARDMALVPLGDQRCRQSWVDALVGVTFPLLQLLETSPVEIESVAEAIETQAHEAIKVYQVQEPLIESKFGHIIYPKLIVKPIAFVVENSPGVAEGDRLLELIEEAAKTSPGVSEGDRLLESIEEAVKISPAALEADRSLPPIEYAAQTSSGVSEVDRSLELIDGSFRSTSPKKIALATVEGIRLIYADWADCSRFFQLLKQKVDEVLQTLPISSLKLLEAEIISLLPSNLSIAEIQDRERFGDLRKRAFWVRQVYSFCQFHCHVAWLKVLPESPDPEWQTAYFEDFSKFSNPIKEQKSFENSPGVESAIGLATKNPTAVETDRNSILTCITFSPGFLAHYSSPQTVNIHYQSDADWQLSLLDFEVESVDEPPDPDDFESLNAFREAIALWDATHPELIEIGLNSFSEWAFCPDDWYEPDTLLEPSEVLELSPAIECSITSEFSLPIFDAWCDRTNGNNFSDDFSKNHTSHLQSRQMGSTGKRRKT